MPLVILAILKKQRTMEDSFMLKGELFVQYGLQVRGLLLFSCVIKKKLALIIL